MKKYCDTSIYGDRAFNGWAMGGQNMCDVHLVLKRLVALRFDGFLEQGQHDWMHFLGTSKLEWALLLTDIQRAVRKYHNPNFTISFDCASPFLATANGQIYVSTEIEDRNKWLYRMLPSADDKKYATDTREFITAVNQDNIFKGRTFTNSPVMENVPIKDICIYKPGDLNKIGKEGKTSWDSFSYAIMMGHNVWQHINSVQEANRQYDAGLCPAMLVDEKFDQVFFKDVIEAIFCTSDRGIAESIVEEYSKFWMAIPGTRGATGKRTINTSTTFANLFDVVESEPVQCDEDYEQDESKLDELEESVK
jgi:tRNA(Leu) C34 or U34 (ribose-2'-O)-methylase TrmL